MVLSLWVLGVLGALLVPGMCEQVTVCVEEDDDLRVDCRIKPKPSQINSYEFSWTSGSKEVVINTNVSGSTRASQLRDHSYVEELQPYGYRLTLTGFIDRLPYNTTYMCKMTGVIDSVYVEKEHLLPCSAVSVFPPSSCLWIVGALLLACCHTAGLC